MGLISTYFPEVSGTITQVLVNEGATVATGRPLLLIDNSIQKAVVEQQKAQAEAALALLLELKAQPRKEVLEVRRRRWKLQPPISRPPRSS